MNELVLAPGTLPLYVLGQKSIRNCSSLAPFCFACKTSGQIIISPEYCGTADLAQYLSSFRPGSLDAFRALLRAICAVTASVINLRDLFISEDMIALKPELVFIERRSRDHFDIKARLVLGEGSPLEEQLPGLLKMLGGIVPGSNAGLAAERLCRELSLRHMSAEDIFAFFSLWLLEL